MKTTILLTALVTCAALQGKAQFKKKGYRHKLIQISLVPGASTNGLHSGWYVNKYSLNILSGFSAANRYFELSVISSLNTQYATGIQLAGIANVIGSNTFLNMTVGEEREQIKEGFESNMTGIQFAGLLNIVRDNMDGWQVTGGINFVNRGIRGWQVAGIANMVGSYNLGVQMAGIYNVALKSSSGIQLALFSNITNGQMQGLQVSLLNKAWTIKGKGSAPPTKLTGWQIGLVNLASKMHGLQIGIINRARQMRGTQIGLINFFSTAPNKEHGKNGTPVGLLNFGSKGAHKRASVNETFLYNFEITSGNCYNCTKTESEMPLAGSYKIMNQNALIFTYNPSFTREGPGPQWAVGYGFEKVKYNKNSMSPLDPKNESKFISYGIRFLHVNMDDDLTHHLSLLAKINLSYGRIIRNKIFTFYIYGGITANAYTYDDTDGIAPENFSYTNATKRFNYDLWPGYELGIHLY